MTDEFDWPEPRDWPDDAERDALMGDWFLYQRRGGHRTSTDDVLTAWFACSRAETAPTRYLDLGCGIGSVLLMTAHRLRPADAIGIEAQPQSVAMARRSVSELPADAPAIEVVEADLRTFEATGPRFDLITGSPPYFPLGTGTLPPDPQRRACRFEARGGVEAYCDAARRHLARHGRFHLVFQTRFDERVLDAASDAALRLTARADVQMRSDREAPFLTVYEMCHRDDGPATVTERVAFAIRDDTGRITRRYGEARRALGLPHGLA